MNPTLRTSILAATLCLQSCGGGGGGNPPQADTAAEDRIITVPMSGLSRVKADPSRNFVYVSDRAQSKVHFLNTNTYQIDKSISVGSSPTQMEISGDGQLLFVMLTGASQVAVVDLGAQALLGAVDIQGANVTGPTSIAAGPNRLLYVGAGSFFANPHIQVHDVSSLPASQLQSFGGGASHNVVAGMSADRTRVYTQDSTTAPTVIQWSTAADPPTQTFTVPGLPYGGGNGAGAYLQSSADSSLVYAVTHGGSNGSGPTDSGVIPIHRTSDGLKVGIYDTEMTPNGIVFDSGGYAAASHSQYAINRSPVPGHNTVKHIHVYNPALTEIGYLNVSDYVPRHGMAVTRDDALVILLSSAPDDPFVSNEHTATRIGVIF